MKRLKKFGVILFRLWMLPLIIVIVITGIDQEWCRGMYARENRK